MTTEQRQRPGWIVGDVDLIVEEIRAEYARDHAPYSSDSTSISDHARQCGYRWMSAILGAPRWTGTRKLRVDHADGRRRCAAVMEAVERVISERLAEIEARQAARTAVAPVAYSDEVCPEGRTEPHECSADLDYCDRCCGYRPIPHPCELVDPCAGGRCTDPEMHAEGGHDR